MNAVANTQMKKRVLWLGLSFLLVAASVLTSCGPADEGQQEQEEREEEVEEVKEVEEVEVPTLSIGETFQSQEVEVTVSDVIITDGYDFYDEVSESTVTRKPMTGFIFLIFSAEIENVVVVGEEEVAPRENEGMRRYQVFDTEGKSQIPRYYFGENPLSRNRLLYLGEKIEGKVIFEVREEASGLKIVYSEYGFPKKELVEWELQVSTFLLAS